MFYQQNLQNNMQNMNPQMMCMNPQMMCMNPQMMCMNPQMMCMNPQMMCMNPQTVMNPQMMCMNPQMMGMNPQMMNNYQQNQQSVINHDPRYKNLFFRHKITQKTVIIQAVDEESLGSVIGKYFSKSGDININIYINNGKKLNESLTVAEAGLIDNSNIEVVSTNDLEGAFIIL